MQSDDLVKLAEYEKYLEEAEVNPPLGSAGLDALMNDEGYETGYGILFQMEMAVIRDLIEEGYQINLQFNSVKVLETLEKAIKVANSIIGEQNNIKIGMNTAWPGNYLALQEFIDLGLDFITLDERKLAQGYLAADVHKNIRVIESYNYSNINQHLIWPKLMILDAVVSNNLPVRFIGFNESLPQTNKVELQAGHILEKLREEKVLEKMNEAYGTTKVGAAQLKDNKFTKIGFDGDSNRLGWQRPTLDWLLDSQDGQGTLEEIIEKIQKIKEKYDYIVLSGMGGSRLGADLVRSIYEATGIKIITIGTTDPQKIVDVLDELQLNEPDLKTALEKTMFVFTSKSGGTQETISHKDYFENRLNQEGINTSEHVWLLTDPGSKMDKDDFRSKYPVDFIQPNEGTDVGGRFTAPTTMVFLLPLLLSVSPERAKNILRIAQQMNFDDYDNIFIQLAAFIFAMATEHKRDKLTFIVPKELKELPVWAEQLIEESLGKDGKGISIVYAEDIENLPLDQWNTSDRMFLRFNLGKEKTQNEFVEKLQSEGLPVFDIDMQSIDDIGGVLLGLERTVATVAYLWDINFVNQPGVEGYKQATREVMATHEESGAEDVKVPEYWKKSFSKGINVYYSSILDAGVFKEQRVQSALEYISADFNNPAAVYAALLHLSQESSPFEVADIAAYGQMPESFRDLLQDKMRTEIFTKQLKVASKLGIGPDRNHSYQQNVAAGPDYHFSTYFLSEKNSKVDGYPADALRAQTIGTVQSLVKEQRKAILITLDETFKNSEKELEVFFKDVKEYLIELEIAQVVDQLEAKYGFTVTTQAASQVTDLGLRGAYQTVLDITASEDTILNQLSKLRNLFSNLVESTGGKEEIKEALKYLENRASTEGEITAKEKKMMKTAVKDAADAWAKRIFEKTSKEENIIMMVRVSEGFGRDEVAESFTANEVILPDHLKGEAVLINEAIEDKKVHYVARDGKIYPIVNMILDVIEGTNQFVTNSSNISMSEIPHNQSGATSVMVAGKGVQDLGNAPDGYVGQFFTNLGQGYVAQQFNRITVKHNGKPYSLKDPELYAQAPEKFIEYLKFLVSIRPKTETLSDLKEEIVLMDRTREEKFLTALEKIKQEHNIDGLKVTTIADGTVPQALKAVMTKKMYKKATGEKIGTHKTIITIGGTAEAFMNLAVAGELSSEGAVGGVRVYTADLNKNKSGNYVTDHSLRYQFTDEEKDNIRKLRPEDAEVIFRGEKLFTEEDIKGPVKGYFSFITNNGVFNQEGVATKDGVRSTRVLTINRVKGKLKVAIETFEEEVSDSAMLLSQGYVDAIESVIVEKKNF